MGNICVSFGSNPFSGSGSGAIYIEFTRFVWPSGHRRLTLTLEPDLKNVISVQRVALEGGVKMKEK